MICRSLMPRLPYNNEMKLTRSAHPRWRPLQLISVLDGPPVRSGDIGNTTVWGHG